MPIDPMTALAAARSTATLAIFLKGLVGALPRGDFQKFQRTIYPFMADQADKTGKGVFAFWFGDVIRVGPGGKWSSVGVTSSIAGAEEVFSLFAEREGTIYVFRCGSGVDWNSPSSIQTGCNFDKMEGSLFGRITRPIIDLFPGAEDDLTSGGPPPAPFPIPVAPTQSGFGFDTPIFAVVALVALFFILPRLGGEASQ